MPALCGKRHLFGDGCRRCLDGLHPGANTLDQATIVKLTRTLAIIPITLVLALWRTAKAKRAGGSGRAPSP